MALSNKVEHVAKEQVVITITGSMTIGAPLKVLDARLQNLVTNGVKAIILDLTEVDFVDSAGLGLLMLARRLLLDKEGAMLRLCGAQARVKALLRMTRTDGILHLDEDLESSLKAIRQTEA